MALGRHVLFTCATGPNLGPSVTREVERKMRSCMRRWMTFRVYTSQYMELGSAWQASRVEVKDHGESIAHQTIYGKPSKAGSSWEPLVVSVDEITAAHHYV